MASHPLFTNCPERWHALLVRAARQLAPGDAEDLAGEVFKNLLERWDRNPTPSLRGFLDAIQRNAGDGWLHEGCRQELRKLVGHQRRRQINAKGGLAEITSLPTRDDPAADCAAKDIEQSLLKGATPDERFLAERLILGHDVRDIAQELCCPLRTVYSWRERLKRRASQLGILNHPTNN